MAHGLGDVKLFAAAGAWVGWQGLLSVLLIGAATGLAAAFLLTRAKGPRAERAGRLRALSGARAVDHLALILTPADADSMKGFPQSSIYDSRWKTEEVFHAKGNRAAGGLHG